MIPPDESKGSLKGRKDMSKGDVEEIVNEEMQPIASTATVSTPRRSRPKRAETEAEKPGIVSEENPDGRSRKSKKGNVAEAGPDTFQDKTASEIVKWSMIALASIWAITFFVNVWSGQGKDITDTIVEIIKTVLTASLGYLFAANKYSKKEQDT